MLSNEYQRRIVLLIPNIRKWIGLNDEFVEEESTARIFDSIIAADTHSAYLEYTLGIQCYATLGKAK